jgi:hypothetical protein
VRLCKVVIADDGARAYLLGEHGIVIEGVGYAVQALRSAQLHGLCLQSLPGWWGVDGIRAGGCGDIETVLLAHLAVNSPLDLAGMLGPKLSALLGEFPKLGVRDPLGFCE